MKDKDRIKELLCEIEDLRRRIAELETEKTDQRRYKDLVDFLPQAVFETDSTGNITFANRVVLEVTGYTPDDIEKGMSGLQLMIPEERDRLGGFMSRVIRGEEHSSMEITALRKDGSTFPAIMFPSPIIDGEKPVGIRGVVVDITAQKQTEEKLRVFSNAVERAIDAIAITDMKGIITYANQSMETTYDYEKGEMLGKSVLNLNSNPEMANEIMSAMLIIGRWEGEINSVKKNKETFPALLALSTVTDQRDNPIAMMGAVRDITELKQADKEVRDLYQKETALRENLEAEIEKRIGFTRNLVHELKTPLTPMIAACDLIMEEAPDGTLFRLARSINQGANTLSKRIDALLDAAKGELGILEIVRAEIDLLDLLHRIAEDTTPLAVSRDQVLRLDIPRSLPIISADEERIRQVIVNLLDNSFKFTPANGKITLRAEKKDDAIIVEIEDTGHGIPIEQQQHMFEAKYHVRREGEHGRGLGLGLILSKMLIELHGGEIWVESQEGKGSKFIFSLPLHSDAS